MVAALWLASYADGCARIGASRDRVKVDAAPHLIHDLDGLESARQCLFALGDGLPPKADVTVHSLLKLSDYQCSANNGPLTGWDEYSKLMRHYYSMPADCYELFVETIVPLVESLPLRLRATLAAGRGGLTDTMDVNRPLCRPGLTDTSRLICGSADAVANGSAIIEEWGIAGAIEDVPVLIVPEPIARVIQAGLCRTVLLLLKWHKGIHTEKHAPGGRWSGPCPSFPPENHTIWRKIGHIEKHSPASFNDGNLAQASDLVRKLANLFDADTPNQKIMIPDDIEKTIIEAANVVSKIDGWRAALGNNATREKKSKQVYSSAAIVDTIRLMSYLKGGSNIADAIERAVGLALPDVYKETFTELAKEKRRRPSASIARYNELALDVPIMLYEQ